MSTHEDTHAVAAAALEEFGRTGSLPEPAALADTLGIEPDQVTQIAPDEAHLRAVCQRYLVQQAAEMAAGVPDFDRFTLQERLGTFVFILLDVLEQHQRFVRLTFPSPLTGPLNAFEGAVRKVIPPVLDAPDVPSVNRIGVASMPSAAAAANGIVWLVRAWIHDDSEDRQRSTALIDRSLSLMAASMTNDVPQRGVDLLRYGVEAGYLPLDRLPFIGDWFGTRPERPEQPEPPTTADEGADNRPVDATGDTDGHAADDSESDAPGEWA